MINYLFFGTPEFAAIVLRKLLEAKIIPQAVICNPDRPVGRKKTITPPPTKVIAKEHKIQVLQPEKLSLSSFHLPLFSFDFFVVAAYAKIIPKEILAIPRLGTIGVHPSLLPRLRGPAPIQTTILKGDKETGVTLYLMDEKVDHGPIIASEKLKVEGPATAPPSVARSLRSRDKAMAGRQKSKWTYLELEKQLADLAGDLLIQTLPKFLKGEILAQPQDESRATYTKKFTTDDGFVDEKDLELALSGKNEVLACNLDRKIRALNPEPGVWTLKDKAGVERRLKILAADLEAGRLRLRKIQWAGEKPQDGYDS